MTNFYLKDVASTVANALAEDLGEGDVTAALIDSAQRARAAVITRQDATIAGAPWVNEVFQQVDPSIDLAGIELENIPASLNPAMQGDEILLGMSALTELELSIAQDTLTLRYRH